MEAGTFDLARHGVETRDGVTRKLTFRQLIDKAQGQEFDTFVYSQNVGQTYAICAVCGERFCGKETPKGQSFRIKSTTKNPDPVIPPCGRLSSVKGWDYVSLDYRIKFNYSDMPNFRFSR